VFTTLFARAISVVKVRIGYKANLFGMLRSANKSPARVNESYIKRTHKIIPVGKELFAKGEAKRKTIHREVVVNGTAFV